MEEVNGCPDRISGGGESVWVRGKVVVETSKQSKRQKT